MLKKLILLQAKRQLGDYVLYCITIAALWRVCSCIMPCFFQIRSDSFRSWKCCLI